MGEHKALLPAEVKEVASTLAVQRVVWEAGSSWPLLTWSNYADWALLMHVKLEARRVWSVVHDGTEERELD